MNTDRRAAILNFGALLMGSLGQRHGLAQMPASTTLCPPGTEFKGLKIKTEIAYQERSMTIAGIYYVSQKIPVRIVTTELECGPKEPPKPLPPPKSMFEVFDLDLWSISSDYLLANRAGQFFTAVNFPSSLASISNTTALFEIDAVAHNGTTIMTAFPMSRSGNGFRFTNPSAVDFWAATTGSVVAKSTWRVSGIEGIGTGYGTGSFGVSHFVGSVPINAYAGTIAVTNGRDQPPGRVIIQ